MWRLVHTVSCRAEVRFAWRFWTSVENWAVDPAVDRVSVEPGFVSGARGTTLTRDGRSTQWQITEVVPGRGAHIEIPAPGATLHIEWSFRPADGGGCLLRQEMHLTGDRAGEYERDLAAVLDGTVPAGMQRLADAIDSAYAEQNT